MNMLIAQATTALYPECENIGYVAALTSYNVSKTETMSYIIAGFGLGISFYALYAFWKMIQHKKTDLFTFFIVGIVISLICYIVPLFFAKTPSLLVPDFINYLMIPKSMFSAINFNTECIKKIGEINALLISHHNSSRDFIINATQAFGLGIFFISITSIATFKYKKNWLSFFLKSCVLLGLVFIILSLIYLGYWYSQPKFNGT